ncbi:MAG: hypothetical protein QOF36_1749 [Microbacteriaceae bacterium]|nr:hypothetical protein [Microbacteriaceae bacterium]
MTDSAETPATPPASWYPDPTDARRLRWWDGGQWTEHFQLPSVAQYGAVPAQTVGALTPVYNGFIWAIAALPILSSLAFMAFDLNAYLSQSLSQSQPGVRGFSLATIPYSLLGWAIYLVSVLLAYFDWRRLQRDGFVRPFHWAWTFLSGGVYVIGRSVIARRRSGRGLAPIWVWAAVVLVGIALDVVKVVGAMAVVMSTVPLSNS